MNRYIIAFEQELKIKNLSPLVAEQIKGSIYIAVVGALYDNQVQFSDEVRRKMKSYLKQYAFGYYFRSRHTPITKIKTLIKRILAMLHIYRYRHK